MARSKRNRVVALTKTKKSVLLDKKSLFVEKLQGLVDKYSYVFTFTYKNMTTLAMQSLRHYWQEEQSQFLLGKSTIMQVALGRSEDGTYKPHTYKLSDTIKGNSGIFFTNKSPESVIK